MLKLILNIDIYVLSYLFLLIHLISPLVLCFIHLKCICLFFISILHLFIFFCNFIQIRVTTVSAVAAVTLGKLVVGDGSTKFL